MLNIAEWAAGITNLGPGSRSVIWTQGCLKGCPGCGSPEWQEITAATLIDPVSLAHILAANGKDRGLTLSGGEPMLQASGLLTLWEEIKKSRPEWTLLIFSGFYPEEILQHKNTPQKRLLQAADAFLGGPYISAMNTGKGLCGSANKKIYISQESEFSEKEIQSFYENKRTIELRNRGLKSRLIVGVPPGNSGHVIGVNYKSENQSIET
jgi:anaerobic ribonucleoside-triphosphate reductase activating protein